MKFVNVFIFVLSLVITTHANEIIDIDAKIKLAQKEDKYIMMFFHIPRCPYCLEMLNENFKDEDVLKLIKNNFLLIDIYTADKKIVKFNNFRGSTKEFAKHIGASAYPATLFLNQNKEVVFRSIGYRNIQEYLPELKYIKTKSYLKKELEEFKIDLELMED